MSSRKVTLDVDRYHTGQYQLAISITEENGYGRGYRLAGPGYIGTSSPMFSHTISESDADEIRALLDDVFPVKKKRKK
jgi:hypothetical protein